MGNIEDGRIYEGIGASSRTLFSEFSFHAIWRGSNRDTGGCEQCPELVNVYGTEQSPSPPGFALRNMNLELKLAPATTHILNEVIDTHHLFRVLQLPFTMLSHLQLLPQSLWPRGTSPPFLIDLNFPSS